MSWHGMSPLGAIASALRASVPGRTGRLRVWVAIAALLALAGVACTVFATRSVSRSDAQKSHQAFVQASSQVASTLRLAIAREQDLVVSAGVFDLENPNASSADFKRWVREEGAFTRYPELSAIASVAFVPRSRLLAFEARAQSDPVGPLGPHGVFAIVPAGVRPYYCFIPLSQNRAGPDQSPAGVDYCASDPQLIESRESGQGYDYAIRLPQISKAPLLAIETPLYRGGGIPATITERRAAFVGWTGTLIVPQILMDSALRDHPGIAVALHDTSGSKSLEFTAGHAPRRSARMTIVLHDGTTVETYALVGSASVFANGNSGELLVS